MGVGNRKVQLFLSCCWAETLLGARDQRSWGSWGILSYSCSVGCCRQVQSRNTRCQIIPVTKQIGFCIHNFCGAACESDGAGGVEGEEGSCKVPFIASVTALEASLPLLQYQRAVFLISSLSYTLFSCHKD